MRILSWNLNHRIRMKTIPVTALSVIDVLEPDLVILNEYVDGPERSPFKEELQSQGLRNIHVSKKIDRTNQVLMASRKPHHTGDLKAPELDDSSETNFCHITLPELALDIVGLRVPTYAGKEMKDYWARLVEVINSSIDRRIIFVGDFNCDPERPKTLGGKALTGLLENGWQIPAPIGEWSYISFDGQRRSRD